MIANSIRFGRSRSVDTLAAPETRAAEAYRRLRTMVELAASDYPGVRLVTSPGAGDGTTTVVANVAVALASAARDVLLIDGNLYRPRLHAVFGLPNEVGLTSVLSGQVSLAEAIHSLPAYPGVRVLTAGPPVLDPAEILSAPAAHTTMAAAAETAPVVFVDGPPLLPVTGGVVLAGLAAGVLIVARAGRTSRSELALALDLIDRTGTPVLGVALNEVHGAQVEQSHYHDRRHVAQRGPTAVSPASPDPVQRGRAPSTQTTAESEPSSWDTAVLRRSAP